jgi:hypothetical protein
MQTETLRNELTANAKTFKTSWIFLGQSLYTVWRDKLYHQWGHEKFEDYLIKELGMKKALGMKLVKTYFFVEEQEPEYLKAEFSSGREVAIIPSYEPLDVLRRARADRNLTREDYSTLRDKVFKKGTDASQLNKDLTSMIKERKKIDPDQEIEARYNKSIKKFIAAIKEFTRDMHSLNPSDTGIIEKAEELQGNVEAMI